MLNEDDFLMPLDLGVATLPIDIGGVARLGMSGVALADHAHRGVGLLEVGSDVLHGQIELVAGTDVDIDLDLAEQTITWSLPATLTQNYEFSGTLDVTGALTLGSDIYVGGTLYVDTLESYTASPDEAITVNSILQLANNLLAGGYDILNVDLLDANVVQGDEVWTDTLHAVEGSPYGSIAVHADLLFNDHDLTGARIVDSDEIWTDLIYAKGGSPFGILYLIGNLRVFAGEGLLGVNTDYVEIYHDFTDGYITTGTGDLILQADSDVILSKASGGPELRLEGDTEGYNSVMYFRDTGSSRYWRWLHYASDRILGDEDSLLLEDSQSRDWLFFNYNAGILITSQPFDAPEIWTDVLHSSAGSPYGTIAVYADLTMSGAIAMGGNAITGGGAITGTAITGTSLALGAGSITGTSVSISNAELQQLSNIGATTISGTQWGYLGAMDQTVRIAATPEFAGMTVTGTGKILYNAATEYIQSGAPGYMDYAATTAHRFNSNVFLDSNGIGVGTAPNSAYPLHIAKNANNTFHVYVSNAATGTIAGSRITMTQDGSPYLAFAFHSSGNTQPAIFGLSRANRGFLFMNGESLGIGTYSAHSVVLGTNNTARLTIDSSGNILVASTGQLQFRDSAIHIASLDDGHLDLTADVSIDLNGDVALASGKGVLGDYANFQELWTDALHAASGSPYGTINVNADLLFGEGGGLAYAEIYARDNAAATRIDVAGTFVQFVGFDTDGASNNCTPDQTNDHITITEAGHYLVTLSIAVLSVGGGGADTIEIEVRKNNGATIFNNLHGHRTLAGGGGDQGSMSISGIIDVAANDTIEVWVANDDSTDDVILEDITLSLVQIGGA